MTALSTGVLASAGQVIDGPGAAVQTRVTQVIEGPQTVPHAPQFIASVFVFTHAFVPTQYVRPAAHPQPPPEHVRGAEHAGAPHAPQFSGSVARFEQVPVPLQYVRPAVHAHAPPPHVRGAAHVMPHPPQFAGSVAGSTQTPPHRVYPGIPPHGTPHVPPEHTMPAGQIVPHPPQFIASDGSAASHPFAGR